MRAKDAHPAGTLFGEEGVSINDFPSLFTGNSWLVSGLAAIAETPGRIEKLFLNTDNNQSPSGLYAVQLYALGLPMTIVVDDYLPAIEQEDKSFTTLFSELTKESPLWTVMIEKAFAKRYGNYEHITTGIPSEAIRALTGNPILKYAHDDMNEETLW